MFSLYRGPKGIFYAHLLSKFALKPPQYLDRRWQKYGEESLQRENNFIRCQFLSIYCVCLALFISSSRKLTSWLCFLSDLYPDLDSWRCPGKHWTWQFTQGHWANLATALVSLPQCRAHGPSPALPILHTPLAITKFHSIALKYPHFLTIFTC